ncbi:MAG: SUMF1/EgtB/PvdO family nonheme iron enzyme [Polyangiaceae bacterium]
MELALPGTKIELVRVAPGSFLQGSDPSAKSRKDDETPRIVTMTHEYFLAKTETTVAQYRAFVTATGYRTEAEKGESGGFGWEDGRLVQKPAYTWKSPGFAQADDFPVVLVTYADAEAFTQWASRLSKTTVRLPTEAEWEFAASDRGAFVNVDPSRLPPLGTFARKEGPTRVRSRAPNALGIFDLGGNAAEWCSDFYGPRTNSAAKDPSVATAPSDPSPARRLLKGGSFRTTVASGRPAARDRSTPGSRNADNGFRILVDVLNERPTANAIANSTSDIPPLTEQAPKVAAASETNSAYYLAMIPAALVGIGLWLVTKLFRKNTRTHHGNGMFTTLRNDGFLFSAQGMPPDAQLEYQARVRGVIVRDRFLRGPSPTGTFVFTGAPPTELMVRLLHPGTRAAAGSYRQQDGSTFDDDAYRRGLMLGQLHSNSSSTFSREHHHHHHHDGSDTSSWSSSSSPGGASSATESAGSTSENSNWSPSAY